MKKDFNSIETSFVNSGIPTYHTDSFLSNFEHKYKTVDKNDKFYSSLIELSDKVLNDDKQLSKYIFLCGTPGSGKTHFMVGLYRALVHKLGYIQGDGTLFVTFANLAQEIISLFKDNIPLRTSISGYTQSKWLFIDDFTSSERMLKEDSLEFNIFRDILIDRYEKGYYIVASSNFSSVDLLGQLDRLFGAYITSRLSDSKIIQFPNIDLRRVR